jgi:glutathione S-transferase
MYILHIGNKNYSSWSLRPWVLMRALSIPFQERMHRFGDAADWDSYRQLAPNGRVPCLQDGATLVWDSLAIAEYLAERHAGVWPADANARAFARCVAAEMHSGFGALRNICSMSCGIRLRLKGISPALATDIARIDAIWSEGVSHHGGPFLAGKSFTAADAFFAPVAFRAQSYGLQLSAIASKYSAGLLAVPAMQNWYAEALKEPWRDSPHEAEILASGTLLEDLRSPAT